MSPGQETERNGSKSVDNDANKRRFERIAEAVLAGLLIAAILGIIGHVSGVSRTVFQSIDNIVQSLNPIDWFAGDQSAPIDEAGSVVPATPPPGNSLYLANTENHGFESWDRKPTSGSYVDEGPLIVSSVDERIEVWPPFHPGAASISSYAIETEFRVAGCTANSDSLFGFYFRLVDAGQYVLWMNFNEECDRAQVNTSLWRFGEENRVPTRLRSVTLETDPEWSTLRIEAQHDTIRVLLNGSFILKAMDSALLSGGGVGIISEGIGLEIRRFEVISLPMHDPSLLFEGYWSDGGQVWPTTESWSTNAGLLISDGSNPYSSSWHAAPWQPQTPDYAVEAEIQLVGTRAEDGHCDAELPSFGIVARAAQVEAHLGYMAGVVFDGDNCEDHHAQLWDIAAGEFNNSFEAAEASVDFEPGADWHTYRLEIRGNVLRFLIDGNLHLEADLNSYPESGGVGLWSDSSEIRVRRFRVFAL